MAVLSKKPAQKALRELSRPVNELINREGRWQKAAQQQNKKTAITEQKASPKSTQGAFKASQ